MTIVTALPLYLATIGVAGAGVGLIYEAAAHRRAGLRLRNPKPQPTPAEQWAAKIGQRLPEAFKVQPVTKAGASEKGARPVPRIVRNRPAAGDGRTWELDLPSAAQAADYDASRIAAALNTGRQLVAAAELHHTANGWADLSLWRRDPIAGVQRWPHAPGEIAPCCPAGVVCIGVRRDGQHLHFDVVRDDLGTVMTLLLGRRGSGKSEAMRLMLAQMLAWGPWVQPVVIDLVRRGVDYAVFEPLLLELVTDPTRASSVLAGMAALADKRAEWMVANRKRILGPGDFTVGMPLHPLVIDEVQAIEGDDRKTFRRIVQQTRPQGIMPVAGTQHGTDENIDTTTQLQAGNKWVGAVGSPNAGYVALGDVRYPGRKPHELSGKGECVCDTDRGEVEEGRTWLMSDAFLQAHVQLLAKRRSRVRVG